MKLAHVVGTVVSTVHVPVLDGQRQLLCDLVDPAGKPTGAYVIALDTVQAGAGELVLILDEGSGARQVLEDPRAPIRALVVGVVDEVAVEEPFVVSARPLHLQPGIDAAKLGELDQELEIAEYRRKTRALRAARRS